MQLGGFIYSQRLLFRIVGRLVAPPGTQCNYTPKGGAGGGTFMKYEITDGDAERQLSPS